MSAPISFGDVFIPDIADDVVLLLVLLYYSYYSIEFYLQVAVNNLVRNEFVDMFKKLWSK